MMITSMLCFDFFDERIKTQHGKRIFLINVPSTFISLLRDSFNIAGGIEIRAFSAKHPTIFGVQKALETKLFKSTYDNVCRINFGELEYKDESLGWNILVKAIITYLEFYEKKYFK